MLRVVVDLVQHGLAAADVVGDVFHVGGAAHAGPDVEARDLDADAMSRLEPVRGRHDLDRVLVDLSGHYRLLRRACERMPWAPRERARGIERPMRGLEPAAGELALGHLGRDLALAL